MLFKLDSLDVAERLPLDLVRILEAKLRGPLSAEGWAETELRAVEECVLGRLARQPGHPAGDVARGVVADVVTLAETRGQARGLQVDHQGPDAATDRFRALELVGRAGSGRRPGTRRRRRAGRDSGRRRPGGPASRRRPASPAAAARRRHPAGARQGHSPPAGR